MSDPAVTRPDHNRRRLACAVAACLLLTGCATHDKWIQRRASGAAVPGFAGWGHRPAAFAPATLAAAAPSGLDPAKRDQRERLLELLESEADSRHAPELEFAVSELAAAQGDDVRRSDPDAAVGFYAEALVHGYRALAADARQRVPGATPAYNRSLEKLLRLLAERDQVRPGAIVPLPVMHGACSVAIELHSRRWKQEDFHSFEFAGDFQVLGLQNHYNTSGVGVPLIGVRYHPDRDHEGDRYYPPKLCYPLTAVARADADPQHGSVRLVLELHDPTDHETFAIAGRLAPLETDLTTPLAYYLDQPELHESDLSTLGLLNPGSVKQLQGLYLLEPFDPDRVPVVMVHGLWSSPATWMEMFNDLRADPRVRERFQFWFYLYPTGDPFWVSAAQLRTDLAELRATFDPQRRLHALDQTVLVGHSMGGLLSRLQTVDSGDEFWRIVTDRRFDELNADAATRDYLANLFYFRPDPAVQRVVTIGTPHRGSRFANGFTQWVGAKLIAFPVQQATQRQELFRRNPDFFRPQIAARVLTSIDSLNPASPVLSALLRAPAGPWVRYHNILGDEPRSGPRAWVTSRGDGVVSVASARLDDLPQLASQIVVPEDHVMIHRHPQAIAEVRRVLLEHLAALEPHRYAAQPAVWPAGAEVPPVRLAGAIAP